jgi:hypothetical protein
MRRRSPRFAPGTPWAKRLQFSIAVYFVICCAVTFLYETALDSYLPVGQSTVLRVDGLAPGVTNAQAAVAVQRIAEDAGRNIYKMTPDPESPDAGRILYGFLGDHGARTRAGYMSPRFPVQKAKNSSFVWAVSA